MVKWKAGLGSDKEVDGIEEVTYEIGFEENRVETWGRERGREKSRRKRKAADGEDGSCKGYE